MAVIRFVDSVLLETSLAPPGIMADDAPASDSSLAAREEAAQRGSPPAGEPSLRGQSEGIHRVNLNRLLVKHPAATFFVRAAGGAMVRAGIHDGDLLVVDRALCPTAGRIIIAALDGDLVVRRLACHRQRWSLVADTETGPKETPLSCPLEVTVWGVVTTVIHEL